MRYFVVSKNPLFVWGWDGKYSSLGIPICHHLANLMMTISDRWNVFFSISLSQPWWIITIHHECPCRIEISHLRGQNFNQGRGLPSPWLNSDPEGEISLSNMDRLMMDCFSPTFFEGFLSEYKKSKIRENSNL